MTQSSKMKKSILNIAILLLIIILGVGIYLFVYNQNVNKDYSGIYKANCSAPDCSFELTQIDANNYIMNFEGEQIKMIRLFEDKNDKKIPYLQNTSSLKDPMRFGLGIKLRNLDEGYTDFLFKRYHKQ